MDFDDHDDGDDEMGLPVASSYDSPVGNPSRGAGVGGSGAPKIGGAGEEAVGFGRSGHQKLGVAGGGRYRECLKNHAVGIGGHAVDGCGEFMAAGDDGTLDALRCAACNCHRNFHRKESDGGGGLELAAPAAPGGYHPHFSPYYRTPAGYLHHHPHLPGVALAAAAGHSQQQHLHQRPAAPLALPSTTGGGGWGSMSRDDDDVSNPMMAMGIGSGGGGLGTAGSSSGKKRFRTKFTQEQKDKMLAFAERLGWRIQKHDEAAVQQFCNETGVKRHVLKVWMHNNKHTLGKKP